MASKEETKKSVETMRFRLTVWPAVELGAISKTFEFETLGELRAAANTAANLLLFIQDETKAMPDYSNVFLSEQYVDGEWVDIEDGYTTG